MSNDHCNSRHPVEKLEMLDGQIKTTATTKQFCTNNSDRQSHLHSFCNVSDSELRGCANRQQTQTDTAGAKLKTLFEMFNL